MNEFTAQPHSWVDWRAPARRSTWVMLGFCLILSNTQAWAQRMLHAPAPVALTDRMIIKYRHEQPGSSARPRNTPGQGQAAPAPVMALSRKASITRKLAESTLSMNAEKFTSFGARVITMSRMTPQQELHQLAQSLMAEDPDIEYAIPDHFIYLAKSPNDPYFREQWALSDPHGGIRAPGAWRLFHLGVHAFSQPRIAEMPLVSVIDTGYRPHVDLPAPHLGLDYLDGSPSPLDPGDARTENQCPNIPQAQASTWHGLTVEGIISAHVNNGIGMAGIAGTGAGILHQRVFGPCGGYLSNYIAAIRDAVDYRNVLGQRVRVINLSQSGPTPCELPLQAEITRAIEAGVVVVASAGNGNTDVSASSPANCKGVISVAATDRHGNRAPYSNHGAVTLSAPGGDMFSVTLNDGILTTSLNLSNTEPSGQQSSDYAYAQGTSFSAPHVSAAAAMLLKLNPRLRPIEVQNLLVHTARPLRGRCEEGCGAGILNLRKAVERLEQAMLWEKLRALAP